MRLSLLWILWLASGLHGAVLAENGLTVIGDNGDDALSAAQRHGVAARTRVELPFVLAAPDEVWAEADGLAGLRRDSDAAPEAFIDDVYLGPLRTEHGRGWRSPRRVSLEAGPHRLLLRCADVQEADDVVLARLRVLGGARERPKASGAAAAPADCGHLRERHDVPAGLAKGGTVLSVLSGREAHSGVLLRLNDGEAWTLRVKLAKGVFGMVEAWETQVSQPEPGLLRLTFAVNPHINAGTVEAKDYVPGAWEPLRITLCRGTAGIEFARARRLEQPVRRGPLAIEIAARDKEIGLKAE